MSSRGFRGPKHCDKCASVRANTDYVISDRNGRREGEREREREDADKKQSKVAKCEFK